MNDKTQELIDLIIENSDGQITRDSENVSIEHDPMFGDLDIRGDGWYLSVDSDYMFKEEPARTVLVILAHELGKLLKSGEYQENVLLSQGKVHEAKILRLERELDLAKSAYAEHKQWGDSSSESGVIKGMEKALEIMKG